MSDTSHPATTGDGGDAADTRSGLLGDVDPDGEPDSGARWLDETLFTDWFGDPPAALADEDEVCCRECGDPVGGGEKGLEGHLGGAHGLSLREYRRLHPAAPTEPPENHENDWSDSDGYENPSD